MRVLQRGQPVMRVDGRKLNLGFVTEWDRESRRPMVLIQISPRAEPTAPVSQKYIECALPVIILLHIQIRLVSGHH